MSFNADYADTEPTRAEVDAISGSVLVEFGAPWCPHCHAVQATLAELFEQHPDVTHVKVYDGPGQPLGRSFRIKLWPNLVFMRDGKVLRQLARPPLSEIVEAFREFINEK